MVAITLGFFAIQRLLACLLFGASLLLDLSGKELAMLYALRVTGQRV